VDSGTTAVFFVILAVVLSALEVAVTGFFVLPFGLGAGVAAVAGFLGAPPLVQAIIFLGSSAGFYLALRPLSKRLNSEEPTEGIGAQRLLGAVGTVLERIEHGDSGMVRIDREEWPAECSSPQALVEGQSIRVIEVRGTRVVVEPEHTESLGRGEGTHP